MLGYLSFTQILFSYCPGPNSIQGSCCLVHSSNEPRRNKIQRYKNGRISVDKKNSPLPHPLCITWFSVVITEYLFLGEIANELSLHSAAFKEIKGPPA